MGFLERVSAAARGAETRNSIDTWLTDYLLPSTFGYGGNTYNYGGLGLSQTLAGNKAQQFSADLPGHVAAVQSSPPAFAAQMVRALVLSQARFTFRTLPSGANPRKLFGNRDLSVLENPWPKATTGELVSRMEWHAGLAGNAFVTNWAPGRLRVLRPDWTAIVYGSQSEPDDPSHALDGKILAYVYRNGGLYGSDNSADLRVIFPDQMAHWSPLPDPLNAGLGMSWLTPAIRDIQGDLLASQHKISFLSNGAPQPLDAKVLTPTGWSTMGAMRVGARVVGADGLPHTVLAVYPQGEQDVYRVSFEDGTSAECTLDHLWQVSNIYDRRRGVSRTTSLHDLLSGGLHYPSGAAKWAVPMVDPIEFDETPPLPVDPYLMGLLLGDGSFRSAYSRSGAATLATAIGDADETQALLAPLLPDGVEIGRRDRGGWSEFRFHGQRGTTRDAGGRIIAHDPNPLTAAIVALGLHNVLGKDKFIPEVFLRASVKERVSLLQGLIDSDGHVEATGLRFCTTSHKLASGVAELVGSLGGVATVRPNKNRSTLTVNVRRLPAWIVPARLLRKADKYKPTSATRVRTIVAAELTRRANTQCIAVDSADHLYVTDEYVVTHNTPNMVVKGLTGPNGQIPTKAQFDDIVDMMESRHAGITNAYRTLYLTAGADATVVGSNLQQMDFTGVQGRGEPLALDTPIPTPTGWTTMGEIKPGDQVIGRDGRPANVKAVGPVHLNRQCYRVTLKDKTSIVADASHLWVATDRQTARRAERIYTTQELYEVFAAEYSNGVGGYRLFLPQSPVVELPDTDLLIDPYVLGAWLGDGQTAGAAICGAREDLKYIASEIEARGYRTTMWQTNEDKVDVIGIPGGLLAALRAEGVLGNKSIPAQYMRASAAQRMDLLRGLMDTDGSVGDGNGRCEFTSKWHSLASQVVELARSLGYRATLSRRADARSRTGETWRVSFRVEQDRIPFLLPRKVDRCIAAGEPSVANRSVVRIEPVESVPVRCIAVDTEDHLFLAGEGFVPTHNTRISVLSRVPAPLLGISEGLAGSSLNAGNFGMARRMFADTWVYPALQDLAAALAPLVKVPTDAELWFDTADMPILREDGKDAAEIEQIKAATITMYVREGFTAESAVAAVIGQNVNLLKHSGLVSVQLQPPGTVAKPAAAPPQGP